MHKIWRTGLAFCFLVSLVSETIVAIQPIHHDLPLFASPHLTSAVLSRRSERLERRLANLKKRQSLVPDAVLVNDFGDSLYRTVITIGTPPQSLPVIVTTGSSDLWVITNQCDNFCVTDFVAPFFPSRSSTFSSAAQTFTLLLENDQTANGTIATDNVEFGNLVANSQRFVAVNTAAGTLQSDNYTIGILGLGFEGVSQSQSSPVWNTLNTTNQLADPLMGVYITRFNNVTNASTFEPGGVINLGYTNNTLFSGEVEYTSVVQHESALTLFDIPLTEFVINGTSIPLNTSPQNPNLATINLGNSFHEGPANIVNQIYSVIGGRNVTAPGLANLGFYEILCNATFTLSLAFNGTLWNATNVDLIFDTPTVPGFCLGGISATTSTLESNTTWIIGNPLLKNVYTVFRWDPPAVGFAPLSTPVLSGDVSFGIPPNATNTTSTPSTTPSPTQSHGIQSMSDVSSITMCTILLVTLVHSISLM